MMTPYQRKQFLADYVAHRGQTWSALRDKPRRFPVRRVGDGFTYHDAASHDDASAFRRRQIARVLQHWGRS